MAAARLSTSAATGRTSLHGCLKAKDQRACMQTCATTNPAFTQSWRRCYNTCVLQRYGSRINGSWSWPFDRKDMHIYGQTGYIFADNKNTIRYRTAADKNNEISEKITGRSPLRATMRSDTSKPWYAESLFPTNTNYPRLTTRACRRDSWSREDQRQDR